MWVTAKRAAQQRDCQRYCNQSSFTLEKSCANTGKVYVFYQTRDFSCGMHSLKLGALISKLI